MSYTEVRFAIPSEVVSNIKTLSDYGYQSFILHLYLDEEISFGKAAKLLGMTHDEFLDFLGRQNIPYFRNSPEQIETALEKLRTL